VLRKDLATVSSHGHLGGGWKEVSCRVKFCANLGIIGHCYFQRMGI
jgi:hypothetical protein